MKRLKRTIAGIMSGILLFAACPIRPAARAAEPPALPDTLTPEMAKAYADKLEETLENSWSVSAFVETFGEEQYPVLGIMGLDGGYDITFWGYMGGSLNQIFDTYLSDGLMNTSRCFKTVVDGVTYCATTSSGQEYSGRGYMSYGISSIYSISGGRWKEVLQFQYFSESGIPEEERSHVLSGGWINSFSELVAMGGASQIQVGDPSVCEIEKSPWAEDTFEFSYFSLSQNGGAPESISSSKYSQYVQTYLSAGRDLAEGTTNFEVSDNPYTLLQALQKRTWNPTYDAPDATQSIDEAALQEMESAISLVVNPEDNTAFESAALTNEELVALAFRGMSLFGDVPVQEDYSGRGRYDWCYLVGGLSCDDISRGIERMIGRIIDFTPIHFKKMPVPGVDIEAFKPFVYDGAFYYFSNESVGWFPYNSEIQRVYTIEDDLFFADASISLNEDEGPGIYYYGHVMTVFQKKDGHYQLLKIYPLNMLPPLDEVQRYAITAAPESNFKVDYTAAPGFTELTQYEDALKAALPAGGLNDAGNSAVTTYLEYAAQNYKPAVSRAKKNVVTISPEEAESTQSGALEAMTALRTVLQDENIALDREPAITARIDAGGLHPEEPLQIRIGKDTVDKLTSVDDLMILLQDSQHAVTIPVDDLKQAGELYIQIEKLSDNEYRISFLDESGKVLERSAVSVTFTVPAANELSTVQAIYGGNSDNWGGQYDLLNQTISFRTIYTGDYSILDSGIEIGDIDMLTPEQQRAIKFMVSRGYFDLDEDGNFSPGTVLNRYSFVRTLVKIFFALDRDAAATFTDVEESSPYYPYVASGQKEEVINGYEDNTFRGENDVLRWHVIAFCSRSLANKKGYARPADPSVYLNFVDNDVIETYKENDVKDIALAVREGLIDNGGVLRPNQEITKAEAAWMLYKLFMLLYEISPVPITIEEEALAGSGGGVGTPVLAGGVAAGGIGIAAAIYFVMKKKRLTVNK